MIKIEYCPKIMIKIEYCLKIIIKIEYCPKNKNIVCRTWQCSIGMVAQHWWS